VCMRMGRTGGFARRVRRMAGLAVVAGRIGTWCVNLKCVLLAERMSCLISCLRKFWPVGTG
jgi:hypothetical protein